MISNKTMSEPDKDSIFKLLFSESISTHESLAETDVEWAVTHFVLLFESEKTDEAKKVMLALTMNRKTATGRFARIFNLTVDDVIFCESEERLKKIINMKFTNLYPELYDNKLLTSNERESIINIFTFEYQILSEVVKNLEGLNSHILPHNPSLVSYSDGIKNNLLYNARYASKMREDKITLPYHAPYYNANVKIKSKATGQTFVHAIDDIVTALAASKDKIGPEEDTVLPDDVLKTYCRRFKPEIDLLKHPLPIVKNVKSPFYDPPERDNPQPEKKTTNSDLKIDPEVLKDEPEDSSDDSEGVVLSEDTNRKPTSPKTMRTSKVNPPLPKKCQNRNTKVSKPFQPMEQLKTQSKSEGETEIAPTERPIANSPGKLARKSPTKQEAKSPAKRTIKSPAKREAKSSARREAKSPAKREAKSPAERTTKSPTKRTTKSPAKREAKSPVKKAAESPNKFSEKRPMESHKEKVTENPPLPPSPLRTCGSPPKSILKVSSPARLIGNNVKTLPGSSKRILLVKDDKRDETAAVGLDERGDDRAISIGESEDCEEVERKSPKKVFINLDKNTYHEGDRENDVGGQKREESGDKEESIGERGEEGDKKGEDDREKSKEIGEKGEDGREKSEIADEKDEKNGEKSDETSEKESKETNKNCEEGQEELKQTKTAKVCRKPVRTKKVAVSRSKKKK